MNITLIGMPGVGKSVVGKELAEKLGYTFLDLDELIEEKTKLKLQEIIDRLGDKRFMEIEEKTILGLGDIDNCIISPGGSMVYSSKAMDFLKKSSIIIFLDLPLKNIREQITDLSTRGIVGLEKGLEQLFRERVPLYRRYADITISMPEGYDKKDAAEEIIRNVFREKREKR
ncbi:AAA family ATPase [Candidatus Woesearchaeota archaeon]|nr:AAA family ATPase [Candidatus Woesearchaeota archaeon]